MRTSTIFAILFFIALAIVTVFLVLCQLGNDVKSQFLNDMQPYLNDRINNDVMINVYNDNSNLISTVYNNSRLRDLFNTLLNTPSTSTVIPPKLSSCIDDNLKTTKMWERNILKSLLYNITISVQNIIRPGGSVRED